MISVDKVFDNPPASLLSDKCKQAVEKCLAEKGTHKFTKSYKAKDITDALIKIYYGRK